MAIKKRIEKIVPHQNDWKTIEKFSGIWDEKQWRHAKKTLKELRKEEIKRMKRLYPDQP
ncbi:hypothetical protein HYZ64_04020 [Candidatus Berkelbacteria bacterium]|nr:hypothetical protein [Candidatus Berkelbacteria bacterium]